MGPTAAELVEQMLTRRPEPETAYRSCLVLIRDAKKYDASRFEAACRRALLIGSPTRKTVLSILGLAPGGRGKRRRETACAECDSVIDESGGPKFR